MSTKNEKQRKSLPAERARAKLRSRDTALSDEELGALQLWRWTEDEKEDCYASKEREASEADASSQTQS